MGKYQNDEAIVLQKVSQVNFLLGWTLDKMEPAEDIERKEMERARAHEDDVEKTSFMGDFGDDFDRFEAKGPREYLELEGNEPYGVLHAGVRRQYLVKQEILYKLFGKTFDRQFGDKMTFFMNKVKLIRENIGPKRFLTSLEYEGARVATYENGKYKLLGNPKKFVTDAQEAH